MQEAVQMQEKRKPPRADITLSYIPCIAVLIIQLTSLAVLGFCHMNTIMAG